jgi:2,3-bisphosphoglycerate-independent phosphoglycerate mutase
VHILLIFLDGVGLGADDPVANPFAAADLSTLRKLAGDSPWLDSTAPHHNARARFMLLDPRLGVVGRPQSGTGQATIVTGRNVPGIIGRHYGPKPDAATRAILDEGNLFRQLVDAGRSAALLEAYPPRWHRGINSGKHLPASYQYATRSAGLRFMDADDLRAGRALSGDWTAAAWRTQLGFPDMPVLTPHEAGRRLVEISREYDFSFFSHWFTDVVGHRGSLDEAVGLLTTFDEVMAGVLDEWDDDEGLVIVTSDHGNIEDLSHGKHTENDVPGVIIGSRHGAFAGAKTLADLAPRIADLLLD